MDPVVRAGWTYHAARLVGRPFTSIHQPASHCVTGRLLVPASSELANGTGSDLNERLEPVGACCTSIVIRAPRVRADRLRIFANVEVVIAAMPVDLLEKLEVCRLHASITKEEDQAGL